MMYTSHMARKYANHATVPDIRRIWAAVSVTPQAPIRELGQQLDMPHSRIAASLRLLKDAGYIDFPKGSERARTILVPFVFVAQER
jgi:hypothetical protein